jgi:hypothetical protein
MARSRKTQDKAVISRLADAGEEALQRLADLPGGKSLLKAVHDMRTRLDDTTTKLRRLDPLERRVSSIEKRLNALEKPKAGTTRKTTARKSAARKSASRAKPKPSSSAPS